MNIGNNKISRLKKKKKRERKHLYAIEDSEQSNLFNMTSAEGKKKNISLGLRGISKEFNSAQREEADGQPYPEAGDSRGY